LSAIKSQNLFLKVYSYSTQQSVLVRLLRRTREEAGLTQEQLGKRLGVTQSFIGKCERGERRIGVIESRAFCSALGISLWVFVETFEKEVHTSNAGMKLNLDKNGNDRYSLKWAETICR
jgi:transcriptional regulator with XRE-family HTH domain